MNEKTVVFYRVNYNNKTYTWCVIVTLFNQSTNAWRSYAPSSALRILHSQRIAVRSLTLHETRSFFHCTPLSIHGTGPINRLT